MPGFLSETLVEWRKCDRGISGPNGLPMVPQVLRHGGGKVIHNLPALNFGVRFGRL
jgi:hypothetical protein